MTFHHKLYFYLFQLYIILIFLILVFCSFPSPCFCEIFFVRFNQNIQRFVILELWKRGGGRGGGWGGVGRGAGEGRGAGGSTSDCRRGRGGRGGRGELERRKLHLKGEGTGGAAQAGGRRRGKGRWKVKGEGGGECGSSRLDMREWRGERAGRSWLNKSINSTQSCFVTLDICQLDVVTPCSQHERLHQFQRTFVGLSFHHVAHTLYGCGGLVDYK